MLTHCTRICTWHEKGKSFLRSFRNLLLMFQFDSETNSLALNFYFASCHFIKWIFMIFFSPGWRRPRHRPPSGHAGVRRGPHGRRPRGVLRVLLRGPPGARVLWEPARVQVQLEPQGGAHEHAGRRWVYVEIFSLLLLRSWYRARGALF